MATPFRYDAVYPKGSRFRRAGRTQGVYYASERPRTAIAEIAFYRLLFFAESPDMPWPRDAAEFTAFSTLVRSARAIDLTKGLFATDRAIWIHPTEYAACQELAETARSANVEVIRYESVRDPDRLANVGVLTCRAFAVSKPLERQTWRIRLSALAFRQSVNFRWIA